MLIRLELVAHFYCFQYCVLCRQCVLLFPLIVGSGLFKFEFFATVVFWLQFLRIWFIDFDDVRIFSGIYELLHDTLGTISESNFCLSLNFIQDIKLFVVSRFEDFSVEFVIFCDSYWLGTCFSYRIPSVYVPFSVATDGFEGLQRITSCQRPKLLYFVFFSKFVMNIEACLGKVFEQFEFFRLSVRWGGLLC